MFLPIACSYGRNITCMAFILYIYPWTNISEIFAIFQGQTKWVVAVAVVVAIVVVEVENAWISGIIVPVTPTFEERVVRIHKVSVVYSYIPMFYEFIQFFNVSVFVSFFTLKLSFFSLWAFFVLAPLGPKNISLLF